MGVGGDHPDYSVPWIFAGIVKGMPDKVLHNTLCKSVFYTC